MSPNEGFEARIPTVNRTSGSGSRLVNLLLEDPQNRFATAFNRLMDGVDARYIDRAFEQPRATLAARITDGIIKDFTHLLKMMAAVLRRVGLNYRIKSYHRANPCVRGVRAADREQSDARQPLFAPDGAALDRHPARGPDPSSALRSRELLRGQCTAMAEAPRG